MTVSIVIPAYNCEKYIERCINSVISQKGAELDIIVVNDGSADGTGEILEKYGDKIRVKTTVNRGISATRNTGIEMARGEYIMFLDADDWLAENTIERLSEILTDTDADIVKFRYRCVFPDGREFVEKNQFDRYEVIEKEEFGKKVYPFFMTGIRLNSMCVGIYRANLVKGRKFREDMYVAEDAVFALGAYTDAKRLVIIPDIMYNYYQTGTGLTGKGVKLLEKYRCNFIFAKETEKRLGEWGMNSVFTKIRVYLRPFILTVDKVKRIMRNKN